MTIEEVKNNIEKDLGYHLKKSGIMFRIFGRAKTLRSLKHKMQIKGDKYRDGAKIQDMIGIRIVLYFAEDVDILEMFLSQGNVVDRAIDSPDTFTFRPQRLNLVRKLPEKYIKDYREALPKEYAQYLDDTYEVQVRTIFSEGWHEVEHDFRYKCKEDWKGYDALSRSMNGVIASLETNQLAMSAIFRQLALEYLRHGQYNAMMRNKMLLRLADDGFSNEVLDYLKQNESIALQIVMSERMVIVLTLMNHGGRVPLTFDNILFLINRIDIMDEGLRSLESPETTKIINDFLKS